MAEPADARVVRELAEPDSRPVPGGRVLLAEAGRRPIAAVSLVDGAVIADPFVPTAEVIELLELRVRELRTGRRSRAPRLAGRLLTAR